MIPPYEVERWRAREAEERQAANAASDREAAKVHSAAAQRYANAIQGAESAADEETKLGLRLGKPKGPPIAQAAGSGEAALVDRVPHDRPSRFEARSGSVRETRPDGSHADMTPEAAVKVAMELLAAASTADGRGKVSSDSIAREPRYG